ncbi:hypothetical protein ACQKL5_13370 [Peribacillus sp. NPDC097675]|uniref:hypothetical protein n=1 Tax=Peribacillus sp. NPDC097675 TaxID=3390618 RepID=UPI003D0320D7
MTGRRTLLYIIISLVFLSGCVNKQENSESIVLNIPNVNEYAFIYIQPIDENGGISETNAIFINDKKKIPELMQKLNAQEVFQSPSKSFNKRIEKLNQQQNFLVSVSRTEYTSHKQFDMIFFRDGSIQYQFTDKKKQKMNLYLSKEKHPNLLQEIKDLAER